MCGISGIFNLDGVEDPERLVRRMNDALAHRGPDAAGVWSAPELVLGHRRLSIIDLDQRPPTSPSARRTSVYTLVFNGEIYNYRELRIELSSLGCEFRTGSDTEVLLAAYSTWGEARPHRLFGMFAFAVWDNERKQLFLARDRLGIKPLYVHRAGGGIVFASELRAVLASGLVSRKVDVDALVENHLATEPCTASDHLERDVEMLRRAIACGSPMTV